MEIKTQLVHSGTAERLEAFIGKKAGKLEKTLEDIRRVEVQLKLIKPATTLNKRTAVTVAVPNSTLFVEKICDIFEEDTDLCVGAMRVQISKYKEKTRAY